MEIKNVIGKYLQPNRAWYNREVSGIKKITVHHTASLDNGTNEEKLKAIMATHVKNDWPGLSYHYVIMEDGTIYNVNEHSWVTWHDTVNWDSLGVCLHGYFHAPYDKKPTVEQLQALKFLLDELCKNHPEFPSDQDDVVGHRERSATACPGDNLFPYVTEYRTKLGEVDWKVPTNMYDLDSDIPSEVEERFELKAVTQYNKKCSFSDLIISWVEAMKSLEKLNDLIEEEKKKVATEYQSKIEAIKEEHNKYAFEIDLKIKSLNDEIDSLRAAEPKFTVAQLTSMLKQSIVELVKEMYNKLLESAKTWIPKLPKL